MPPVCVLFHPCVTCISSYVIHMSLVCTRMSSVYHLHVLICHSYVTFKDLWDVSLQTDRSVRPRVFLRKGVLKICWKFTEKQRNRTSACVFSCQFFLIIPWENASGQSNKVYSILWSVCTSLFCISRKKKTR